MLKLNGSMSLNKSIEKNASRLECFVTFLKESGPFVGENPSKMATKQKFGKFSMKCLNQFPGFVLKVIFYGFYHGKSPLNWIKLIKTTIWENIFGNLFQASNKQIQCFFPVKIQSFNFFGQITSRLFTAIPTFMGGWVQGNSPPKMPEHLRFGK